MTTQVKRWWPVWARAIARKRIESETGVGDTVARIIAPVGGDVFKVWYRKATGRDCRCLQRQAGLNQRYPYELVPTYEGQV
jgi:hypothetical protein